MISEDQLETWCNQGAIVTAKATHETIRRCLIEHDWPIGVRFDDYLQGSYRNGTNIRGDSDVDIVIELRSTFKPDTSRLSEAQRSIFNSTVPDSDYDYRDFHREAVSVLRSRFGSQNVRPGKMAIKVIADSGRVPADVVVATTHRTYDYFFDLETQSAIEGIAIKNQSTGAWIVNYPKFHVKNGAEKNGRVSNRYKPSIRMMKNARERAIALGFLDYGVAPSYFVECLMYNIDDSKFRGSWSDIFFATIEAAVSDFRMGFKCQNEIFELFGEKQDQWKLDSANKLASALLKLAKER